MKDPLKPLAVVCSISMLVALGAVFAWVPTEEFQGVVQRIFYVHVPAAWIAYLAFTLVLIGSIAYLKSGSTRWDHLAHASAEVGVVFTGICLVTGMLWGKPVWGTYWRWDPRLTLTFVLFLIYVGYLVLRATAEEGRGERLSAVVGITGFVTIPLIHFSVDWWRGQHPGRTVINPEGAPQLPGSMLITLLFMLAVFTLLFTLLLSLRIRLARLRQEVAGL